MQSRIKYEIKSANIRRERGEHKMFANRCYIMCSKRWREKNSKKGRLFFSSTFCCHSPITMCWKSFGFLFCYRRFHWEGHDPTRVPCTSTLPRDRGSDQSRYQLHIVPAISRLRTFVVKRKKRWRGKWIVVKSMNTRTKINVAKPGYKHWYWH